MVPGAVMPAAWTSDLTPSKSATVIMESLTRPTGLASLPTERPAGIPVPASAVHARKELESLWSKARVLVKCLRTGASCS